LNILELYRPRCFQSSGLRSIHARRDFAQRDWPRICEECQKNRPFYLTTPGRPLYLDGWVWLEQSAALGVLMMSIRSIGSPRGFVICTLSGVIALLAACGGPSYAVVTSTTAHSETFDGFDSMISSTDLIQGMIPFENPGDLGWHPANTNPADRLAAFTDGLGGTNNLTGLLNDTATSPQFWGLPVKQVEYVFDSPVDVSRINILTGNKVNKDGRIYSTTVVNYSTDGVNFDLLGYFQSDPSGAVNREVDPVPPLDPAQAATYVSIFDNASSTMLSGVTNLEFHFYSVSNTLGEMRDPFDGVNPFLADIEGNYNDDAAINAADYVVWRDQLGDQAGYDVWKMNFGAVLDDGLAPAFESPLVWEIDVLAPESASGTGSAAVPEPASWALLIVCSITAALRFRGRIG
jgi:hypothetical protein